MRKKSFKHSPETILKMSMCKQGENHPNWKGGIAHTGEGYVMIYSPNHPFATKTRYVMEHRLVMEKCLGRYLAPKEVVHHVNKKITDNRIENLKLFASNGIHSKKHKNGKFRNGNTITHRRCSFCKHIFPLSKKYFHRSNKTLSFQYRCIKCHNK